MANNMEDAVEQGKTVALDESLLCVVNQELAFLESSPNESNMESLDEILLDLEALFPPLSPDSEIAKVADSLLCREEMDRESPELWPETLPGVTNFSKSERSETKEDHPWNKELNNEDVRMIDRLSALPAHDLITEVKKLFNLAHNLGQQEAKEMTRGKYLNVLGQD